MGKKFVGENTFTYFISLIKNVFGRKVDKDDIVNNLTSADATKVLSAAQGKALADQIVNAGGGDMMKAIYDTDDDGVVDNAKALEGHGADYFSTPESVAEYVTGLKGQAGGLVPLQDDSKINSIYLPSYVDDVIEGYYAETKDGDTVTGTFFYQDEAHTQLITGESGKIYVDLATNNTYRYSGTVYVMITSSDMVEISNTEVQNIWDAVSAGS